jgi:hypothetical protein
VQVSIQAGDPRSAPMGSRIIPETAMSLAGSCLTGRAFVPHSAATSPQHRLPLPQFRLARILGESSGQHRPLPAPRLASTRSMQ